MDALEQVDQALLHGLVEGYAKTPLAALYLELGCLPLRFIWASRRILYLHIILKSYNKEGFPGTEKKRIPTDLVKIQFVEYLSC